VDELRPAWVAPLIPSFRIGPANLCIESGDLLVTCEHTVREMVEGVQYFRDCYTDNVCLHVGEFPNFQYWYGFLSVNSFRAVLVVPCDVLQRFPDFAFALATRNH
jgi:hypothetical protein